CVLLSALDCEPSNKGTLNSQRQNAASPPPRAVDDGPITESGPAPPSGKYWRGRSADEAYDDETKRRQGSIGPCGQLADTCIRAHEDWQTGQITEEQFLDTQRAYDVCCNQYYPNRCVMR